MRHGNNSCLARAPAGGLDYLVPRTAVRQPRVLRLPCRVHPRCGYAPATLSAPAISGGRQGAGSADAAARRPPPGRLGAGPRLCVSRYLSCARVFREPASCAGTSSHSCAGGQPPAARWSTLAQGGRRRCAQTASTTSCPCASSSTRRSPTRAARRVASARGRWPGWRAIRRTAKTTTAFSSRCPRHTTVTASIPTTPPTASTASRTRATCVPRGLAVLSWMLSPPSRTWRADACYARAAAPCTSSYPRFPVLRMRLGACARAPSMCDATVAPPLAAVRRSLTRLQVFYTRPMDVAPEPVQLVSGLPVANHDHGILQQAFAHDGVDPTSDGPWHFLALPGVSWRSLIFLGAPWCSGSLLRGALLLFSGALCSLCSLGARVQADFSCSPAA